MTTRPPVNATDAAAVLRAGGIVAHPAEAVWGLGCDPLEEAAVMKLLALKRRSVDQGLILVAASVHQLEPYADFSALPGKCRDAVLASWPGPHTWIVPATPATPAWIRGAHPGVAVRVSAHAPVIALCNAFGGALVSTSANVTGGPPPRDLAGLEPTLGAGVDAVLAGETGSLEKPTAIRDALTGAVLR